MSKVLEEFVNNRTGVSFLDNPGRQIGGAAHGGRGAREEDFAAVAETRGDVLHGEHKFGKSIVKIDIPRYKMQPERVVNKSIIIYGGSQSGKTKWVKWVMSEMRRVFPIVIVLCPTASANRDYDGIVPDTLIYESFTAEDIKRIYDRQCISADVYRKANRGTVLRSLFERVAAPTETNYVRGMEEQHREGMRNVPHEEHVEREENFQRLLLLYYKKVIGKHTERLRGQMGRLTEDEQHSLKFLWFNPRMLVIFDDAMTEIMKIIKTGRSKSGERDDTIKNFFFKGRHSFITHFYLLQDDANIDSDIRKNAFYSVFTSPQTARSFFDRSANSYTKEEKLEANAAISTIFSEENEGLHYKLIYSRLDPQHFHYTAFPLSGAFKMCSENVWKYCQRIVKEDGKLDEQNPFYRHFAQQLVAEEPSAAGRRRRAPPQGS